ncbi:MAG: DUF1553 domain-containing protein, partial [Planctomycetota bacterium]|nr:DUF1553 domain-containing protein [Planctomycetota bacterium]
VFLLSGPSPAGEGAARADRVQFNRDIRPILAENCFPCHGPDRKKRRARLRLDEEKGIRRVVRAEELEESEAWRRITSDDEEERMPPPDAHRELETSEIALIRRWIEEGAEWQGHWAYVPPRRPPIPDVRRPVWVRNAIDAFVLARLEREELSPGPEADRETLIRRLTLDLTGLPPTIEEIDAFLADASAGAYERLVDRLLASPHHGERLALAWMDAARYGDSSVFHADGPRDMWPWRDWVIRAYNEGKPFDEFTVEQLAGDLLPESTVEQQIATGFSRNNATTDEGGAIAEEYRVEYAVDRVKTTSLVWMALSMECAQCHEHKYEPIAQEEYYQFFAYFNQAADPGMQTRGGNQAPVVDVPNYALRAELPRLEGALGRLEAALEARAREAEPAFVRWVRRAEEDAETPPPVPEDLAVHLPLDEKDGSAPRNSAAPESKTRVQGKPRWGEGKLGGAFLLNGKNFIDAGNTGDFERTDAFSYGAWLKPRGKVSGAPIARMDDGNRHRGYDLFLADGRLSMHLIHSWPDNALKVTTKSTLKPDAWQHVFITYDGSSRASGVKIYVDGESQELQVEQDRLSETTRTDKPLTIGRRSPGSPFRGAIDDVRFYPRRLASAEVVAIAGSDPIGPILAIAGEERTQQQVETLRSHYLGTEDSEYRSLAGEADGIRAEIARAKRPVSTVMVMQDVSKPRKTFVLERGNYAAPRKDRSVEPGTPDFLPPLPEGAGANRLGMARWLVQPQHPLTARVAVNRYWQLLFGRGIVETVADFGSQGEWPSHPALLDWLAVDFAESGWNTKRALRQMVLSSTYRQSSATRPELLERDPENRLFARGARFRLEGEFIRDGALAASGLLSRRIGGPGVKPYQPPGLWNEVSLSAGVRFVQDKGEKLYRRSMYTYWKRSAPAPSLTIFDAPTREKCVLRRSRTTTPLQALVTLNDPQFVEAARFLAERAMRDGGATLEERIVHAYRLVASSRPRPGTLKILEEAYREELAVFRQDLDRARGLLSTGDAPRDERLDAAEHAAMTIVASLILNLDSTVTRG